MRLNLRSPLFLMALTVFIDFTGFGLAIPLLPFWAEHLGANAVTIGALSTGFAAVQFICTPILGALSDRIGRKPIILGSLVIEALAFALTALAGSLPVLFAARAIGGLGASNIGSAQAVIADITPRAERARAMGLIGAAIGLGFVVGPALGGLLAPVSPALPFWVSLGVALLNALFVWAFLPETRRASSTAARRTIWGGWRTAFSNAPVARLIAINLIYTVAFTGMETVFALFTQRVFGWTAMQNGLLFTYIGVCVVVMQGGLVGRLVKTFGERKLLLGGLLLLAAGLILLPWSANLALILLTLGILSVGDGAVTPIVSTLLSFASQPETQGETLGVAQGIAGLGRVVGPLIAGALFGHGAPFPFLFGGALALGGAALALSFLRADAHTLRTVAPTPINPSHMHSGGNTMNPISSYATTQSTAARRFGQTGVVVMGALFAVAILLQVFLAGAGIFAAPNYLALHRMFGYMLSILPLLAVGLALLARQSWRMVTLYGVAFVLVGLQGVLIDMPETLGLPLLKALHPVNALIIFALSLGLLYVSWRERHVA